MRIYVRWITVGPRLEEVKIVVIEEASSRESVLQHNSSGKEAI